ncbi:MAG: hypothetical protein A3K19_07315 [Lentisphaerae bacterium RIFOXYB12_FULL_65_16]|nr:MAG: hypothetical protein A3K18_21520 [Lentisphaerae bacterium RIFOXYA12_64_32]OGV93352.1 MAG: hypothetical protein A3K19_07315 [Lentisphaerae bacterium RIFOXYB12_FULL_65_16]
MLLLGLGAVCTGADITVLLKDQAGAQALLASNPIHVHAAGHVDATFDRAVAMFMSKEVLDDVQAEYARQLPAGETPEFVVHQTESGQYHYVNKDKQRSEVRELYKATGPDGALDAIFLAEGTRFFGAFEALVHLNARPGAAGKVDYDLNVYARPRNSVCRWLGHLPPVRKFFQNKTQEVADLSARICAHLSRRETPAAPRPSP